jgi:hypothetical protein
MAWNFSEEKNNALLKTWFLLCESTFSVHSNILVVVVKPVFYNTGSSSLSYCLLLFCAGQWPSVQPLICDYVSSHEIPAPQPRCWCRLDLCYKSSLVSSGSTLDLICIYGIMAINATTTSTSLCPVVIDARKIDCWILLFRVPMDMVLKFDFRTWSSLLYFYISPWELLTCRA